MADVRLTATNPEDSSVVPVACDASGRLLLEEQGQGPPGPEGPPGPKGDDGDPFSGNFAGDVSFSGSASIVGNLDLGDKQYLQPGYGGMFLSGDSLNGGTLFCYKSIVGSAEDDPRSFARFYSASNASTTKTEKIGFRTDGSATFAGQVDFDRSNGSDVAFTAKESGSTKYAVRADGTLLIGGTSPGAGVSNTRINPDGTVTFAAGKAGFTAEGYLWCTTRRGDTVILDATSNGLASWVEYTPTSRIDDLRDKLDANRPDTGEMPADTP